MRRAGEIMALERAAPAAQADGAELAPDLVLEARTPPGELAAWLAVERGRLPTLRALVRVEDLDRMLRSPGAEPLLRDVAALARRYAEATGEAAVQLRLERIDGDECRAFHRDNIRLRLLATYLGPGTQYVAAHDAERALRLQGAFRGPVLSFPAHAVGWVRGAAGGAGEGLVHRSPPIAGTGAVRLLLAVDAPSRASPPVWSPGAAEAVVWRAAESLADA